MSLPPGYPATAPALTGPIVSDQRWVDVAFVHWPVRPDTVTRFFPRGTRPDVFGDGYTYVGLVPFAMRRAGIGPNVAVPYFGSFLETNVRLYSVDEHGRHGVLFRSLDTSRLAIVPLVRTALGIAYSWSRMRLAKQGDVIRYDSKRRLPHRGLQSHLSLRIGARVEPTPLEVFLTARWGAHTSVAGRTLWVPNEHGPWPLHVADVLELRDDLIGAGGVVPAGARLRALWSPAVRTRFGRPTLVI